MANQPPVANYNTLPTESQDNTMDQVDQEVDPLISTLSVSMVPGNQNEPILSMHVSQSFKKQIWAGE